MKFHPTNSLRQVKRAATEGNFVGVIYVLQQLWVAADFKDGAMVQHEEWRDVPLIEE